MTPLLRYMILLLLSSTFLGLSAQIRLKNRIIDPASNIGSFSFDSAFQASKGFGNKIFCILHFNSTVTTEQKQALSQYGIQLYHYIPSNAYTAVISQPVSLSALQKNNVNAILALDKTDKLSTRLLQKKIPSWSIKQPNAVDVIVHFSKAMKPYEAENYFLYRGYVVIDKTWKDYHFITLRIPQEEIDSLASIPFVEYIEPVAPEPKTLNFLMRANTRANVLNAPVSAGGEGLRGRGVTIGVGDDGDPSSHVDLQDRLINRAAGPLQSHATHVAGIAAGAGLKDPMFQGVAPEATIIAQLFNGIFLNAATYIADHRMVVTNNSWGNITGECDLTGVYDTYSKLIDDICIQHPYLLNVFAAGNDGPFTCQGFPQQYHTIVSGHQSAKNVLSVGWGEKNQTVSAQSSIGPTADGRLKPEITSQGSGLRSTSTFHDYLTDWGTSMAAPTVSGGAALLIEKFRQMNGGSDPKSGLIKALLMNGATDIATPAPDYKSGYGFLHLVRSLDMLKNNRYFINSINTGGTNNHPITVPAGVAQLKVMVYWHDPSAAVFAQKALVNDLDLELVTPGSASVLPWKLTGDSTNATAPATRAADHLNNSEQVTIDDPAAGTYTVRIKGTAVNIGASQEYFVVVDYVPAGVDITFPSAGDPLVPGESIVVMWDAWGGPANDFTLQYSTDNGVSWNNISTTIPSNARQFTWTTPNVVTGELKLRLIRNGSAHLDETAPMIIVPQPALSFAAIQCEDHISIEWPSVSGATDYEVMMKQGSEMVTIATTTIPNYIFEGLNKDSSYWVTVRARINAKPGRRAVALNRRPNTGSCAGSISDNDLKLDSVTSPVTGRKFTSTEITSTTLSVRIKNIDDAAVTNFSISYSVNGSSYVTENVTATIAPQSTYIHTFTGLNFSAAGTYNVVAVIKNNVPDANASNDTFRTTIRQLPNAPVTLPITETFEAAPVFEITRDVMGLPGLDRWDFINSTDTGRVRSFVNSGIAKSGNRAITLDAKHYTPSGNTNFLVVTYNLSNYTAASPNETGLKLEFSYKHHGQQPHADNKVWARRSDTDPWIIVYNLDSLSLRPGEWKTVLVDLSTTAAAISPTTSFQVRFGQRGNFAMGDDVSTDGITIDDVSLIQAAKDVQIIAIDSPFGHSCNLNTSVPLTIRFQALQTLSSCIPVKYRVDNGPIITECAPSSATAYTFVNKINVSSPGPHSISVWLDVPNEEYRKNDSILNYVIYNKPVITSFPHLENFENGPGNWHTEGYRSSWEYGTPASLKIKSAASGTKAWKTQLVGQYNEYELSYLYSPCYDISSLASPFLTFKMALDIEQCGIFVCDKLWMEYSADGKTWTKLGSYGQGTNWYNNKNQNVWDSAGFTNWHDAGIELPSGVKTMQLRFVLQSDAGVTREGVAIDDIRIFDKAASPVSTAIIAPNPTNGIVNITTIIVTGQKASVQLFDVLGRKLMQQSLTGTGLPEKYSLNIARFAKGMYFLKISDGANERVFKLVKQ